MEDTFDRSTLDAVLHAIDTDRWEEGFESDDDVSVEPVRHADHFPQAPVSRPPNDESSRFARARRTVRPRRSSSPNPSAAAANEGILLVGGPYRGTYVRENLDANGVYLVSGALGDFVYRLYQRKHEFAIAVPFDATTSQIHDALFKQAGKQTRRRKAQPGRAA